MTIKCIDDDWAFIRLLIRDKCLREADTKGRFPYWRPCDFFDQVEIFIRIYMQTICRHTVKGLFDKVFAKQVSPYVRKVLVKGKIYYVMDINYTLAKLITEGIMKPSGILTA